MALTTNMLIAGASALVPLLSLPATALAAGGGALSDPDTAHGLHFHSKGKGHSAATIELWLKNKGTLPFDNTRDFEEAKKGLIAVPPYKQILKDDGTVMWDMESYEWLLNGEDFESIHPSLQRQAVLNMACGLWLM